MSWLVAGETESLLTRDKTGDRWVESTEPVDERCWSEGGKGWWGGGLWSWSWKLAGGKVKVEVMAAADRGWAGWEEGRYICKGWILTGCVPDARSQAEDHGPRTRSTVDEGGFVGVVGRSGEWR